MSKNVKESFSSLPQYNSILMKLLVVLFIIKLLTRVNILRLIIGTHNSTPDVKVNACLVLYLPWCSQP